MWSPSGWLSASSFSSSSSSSSSPSKAPALRTKIWEDPARTLIAMTSSSFSLLFLISLVLFSLGYGQSPSCGFTDAGSSHHHHHGGDHTPHHHHHLHDHENGEIRLRKLPEELAEEQDLEFEGFDHHHQHHHRHEHDEHDVELSPVGKCFYNWMQELCRSCAVNYFDFFII